MKRSESIADLAIVIAVRNGAKTIGGCIESLGEVFEKGAKLYVFDGLSSDNTRDIVLSRVPQAHYVCAHDGGLYFAWNNALKAVHEEFVFFINCDDSLYSSGGLFELLQALRANTNLVAASGKTIMRRRDGAERFAGRRVTRDWFACEMPVVTPATIFRVAALRNIGGFSTGYRIASDYDAVLRLLLQHGHKAFAFLDRVITRFSLGGMSNNNRGLAMREIREIICENLTWWHLGLHRLWYVWNGAKRWLLWGYFQLRC